MTYTIEILRSAQTDIAADMEGASNLVHQEIPRPSYPQILDSPGVCRISLMRLVTADLNDRMIVGIDPATGCPNRSTVGARRAVPLPSETAKIP